MLKGRRGLYICLYVNMWRLDEYFYDANEDYYHDVGHDGENYPTSQFLGTDWTAIEGIVAL